MNRAWIEIDLGAVQDNLDVIRKHVGGKGVWAVVKADAYGHGINPVSRALDFAGIDGFACISLAEARMIRHTSLKPVLIIGYLDEAEMAAAVSDGFHLSLYDLGLVPLYEAAARLTGRPAIIHLNVETGLNRLGIAPAEAAAFARSLDEHPDLKLFGLMTHLSNSADRDEDLRQLTRFQEVVDAVPAGTQIHMVKSHALSHFPEGVFDFVRVGLAVYGFEEVISGLTPAMAVKTVVMQRKPLKKGEGVSYGKVFVAPEDMEIAVLAMGYNEGLSLSMSEKIDFLINGHRVRQIGRICMNLCMVDVTGIPAERGDEAVVLGSQGDHSINACEIAERTGLRQHEIVTRMGRSLTKRYLPMNTMARPMGQAIVEA